MISVIPLDTPGLGDRSYLAHDGTVAAVVDPQRDFDRVLALADAHGVRITHVFETHIHNDYVSGGLALAKHVDAQYLLNADDEVDFDRVGLSEGDVVEVGPVMRVRALHTPGHTHTHLSYVLEADGESHGAFTGGSLLFSSTGRPDLLGPAHTDTLVHDQWRSAHRLANELPEQTPVFPTHGFGSFCSATQSDVDESTIGRELRENPALTRDEQEYVDTLLGGLEEFPAYYARMAPANSAGPSAPDLAPPTMADPEELRRRMDAGEWLIDLRHREAFAAGHLPGTLNFGLDGPFVTYLGWLIPWGTSVILLGETAEQVAAAQREMSRIGLDRPAAMATGDPRDWRAGSHEVLGSFPRADFADLQTALSTREDITVLDVRRASEFDRSHIERAVNVPIHNVLAHLDDLPRGPLWVHCAGGYRASVVASLLDAHGFDVVAVDESYDAAEPAGLPLVAAA